ncbi:MAG: pyridoxine 5'-phosphate synthase [Gemmatimonadetes bacterium]|nr:pyridoxine 5'-phosphate synthase [Gemmatimonadota bacterium]
MLRHEFEDGHRRRTHPCLSVNLNRIALLRNSRGTGVPSVEEFAGLALAAGADGLTLHPRPDQRHARDADVLMARELTTAASAELNIEGNPCVDEWLGLVVRARPDQATLVPDAADARTSERGWDFERADAALSRAVMRMKHAGIRVSLFIEPDPRAVRSAAAIGADRVELRTEPFARAIAHGTREAALPRYVEAALAAQKSGLGLNAGHDLDTANLPDIARLPGLLEVSIGHALTVDALRFGFDAAIRRYRAVLRDAIREAPADTAPQDSMSGSSCGRR